MLGGSEIELDDYKQEGYRLMAVDSNGEEAFGIYTLPDSDVTLTLNYVKKSSGNESLSGNDGSDGSQSSGGGCSGGIGSGAGLLALLVLSVSGITFKRKKDD